MYVSVSNALNDRTVLQIPNTKLPNDIFLESEYDVSFEIHVNYFSCLPYRL